jgi:gamma-glutamyltranspeptidase/glutathione hydrolase
VRRRLITAVASPELRPGRPGGREILLPDFTHGPFDTSEYDFDDRSDRSDRSDRGDRRRRQRGTGDPGIDPATGEPLGRSATAQPQARRGDTCHLDVADRWGNVVSATPSGGWLQSSPVIPALGFCLGTRAQMFTLTPGLPATIAPGKRPRTTLTPTLALREGEPCLAFGTPGGDQQDQWTLAFFLNHAVFGMNLQQAIDFPAFHSAHMPSSFYPRESYPLRLDVEERVGSSVIEDLRRRGHDVHVQPPWSLGRISAVARRNGMLYAAANARGMQGYAVGR